jgi:hypothetical protein
LSGRDRIETTLKEDKVSKILRVIKKIFWSKWFWPARMILTGAYSFLIGVANFCAVAVVLILFAFLFVLFVFGSFILLPSFLRQKPAIS